MNRSLALVGLPGSGKSSVGRQLARRLGIDFIDTDTVIEHRLDESIRSYFHREGEARFRDVEQAVLTEICQQPALRVLATGGGAVVREPNRRVLGESSTVIYLHCSPEELHRRLRRDTKRPLLQVDDPRAALQNLYEQRDPLYREVAEFVVETGRPTVHALVGMMLMQLELAGCVDAGQAPSTDDVTQS